jgi:hypothetical protein
MWTTVTNQPPEWKQTPESKRWMWFQAAVMLTVAALLFRYNWRINGGDDDADEIMVAIAMIFTANSATVLLSRFIDWVRRPW